jgi:hypothetical protein
MVYSIPSSLVLEHKMVVQANGAIVINHPDATQQLFGLLAIEDKPQANAEDDAAEAFRLLQDTDTAL